MFRIQGLGFRVHELSVSISKFEALRSLRIVDPPEKVLH